MPLNVKILGIVATSERRWEKTKYWGVERVGK